MADVETLGTRIKNLRLERDRTLRGLAKDAGIAPSFLVDIEADRRLPGAETLAALAASLDVPLVELQELDPRLSYEYAEAFRLALTGEHAKALNHVSGLDTQHVKRLHQAAALLAGTANEILIRRPQ